MPLSRKKPFARIIELVHSQCLIWVQEEPEQKCHLVTITFNVDGQRVVVTVPFKGPNQKEEAYYTLKKANVLSMSNVYNNAAKQYRLEQKEKGESRSPR